MKKVLLHICCGVCALYAIEKLKKDGYCPEGLFFNPNIYPAQEYHLRAEAAHKAANIEKIKLTEIEYEPLLWLQACGRYKDEKEGGARCRLCYQLRLQRTFDVMREKGFDCFTTTLTISPHKNSGVIGEIGKDIGSDSFLAMDFKKQDGFKKTVELAKKHDFYCQKYCGCIFSQGEKITK